MWPLHIQTFTTDKQVAEAACQSITQAARTAIQARGVFRLVLAGGSTPQQTYALLTNTKQDWARWEIFWGDERCLSSGHPERNDSMARKAWLDHVAIPETQCHSMPISSNPFEAAAYYAHTIAEKLPFDLVLLGMGEDGHTASLFPNDAALHADSLVTATTQAPKPPPERVSLSIAALQNCRQQLMLVTGKSKAAAVAQWKMGAALPIAQTVTDKTQLFLDEAANGTK